MLELSGQIHYATALPLFVFFSLKILHDVEIKNTKAQLDWAFFRLGKSLFYVLDLLSHLLN